jgi:hypothetical protein
MTKEYTMQIPRKIILAGLAGGLVLLVLLLVALNSQPTPPPELTEVMANDFDLYDPQWPLPTGWEYQSIFDLWGMSLSATNNVTAPYRLDIDPCTDAAVQVRVWVQVGTVQLHVRQDENSGLAYTATLSSEGDVALYRGSEQVAVSAEPVENISYGPPWHTIRLDAVQANVTVTVDEEPIITWSDSAPLPAGGISIDKAEDPTGFFMDDLELWLSVDEASEM